MNNPTLSILYQTHIFRCTTLRRLCIRSARALSTSPSKAEMSVEDADVRGDETLVGGGERDPNAMGIVASVRT